VWRKVGKKKRGEGEKGETGDESDRNFERKKRNSEERVALRPG